MSGGGVGQGVRRLAGLPRQSAARWRRSLRFRVIATTVVGTTVVVFLLLPALLARVSSGILSVKEASALAEAVAARAEAQRLLDATSQQGTGVPPSRRIDAVISAIAARGAQAGLFEVLVLSSEPGGLGATPERGTNLVSEGSVPAELREVVAAGQRQAWTYTTIRYTDGHAVPGFVVGAPLAVRGVGPYELYQLFPLVQEQRTLTLVRAWTTAVGLLIIAGLAGLAVAVTYSIVTPVHDAARTAHEFSAGNLAARMRVRGRDDLAQLAVSFNDMAGTLQRHIGALEDLSSVQQRFVADVSHELRTPMTTVRMAADHLHDKRADLPPDDARAVELLHNQLDRFESLLGDLLETSRHDAGAVQLAYEDVDLVEVGRQVVSSMGALADEMLCRVRLVGPPSLVVPCDPARVERILANLVSNAIEHGEGTPVEVRIEQDDRAAQVAVTDHGVGLAPEQVQSVFTRFWRADPSRVRRVGGTGLGLSIALGDARAHGGTLTARGAPGAGATFTLRLPLDPAVPLVAP